MFAPEMVPKWLQEIQQTYRMVRKWVMEGRNSAIDARNCLQLMMNNNKNNNIVNINYNHSYYEFSDRRPPKIQTSNPKLPKYCIIFLYKLLSPLRKAEFHWRLANSALTFTAQYSISTHISPPVEAHSWHLGHARALTRPVFSNSILFYNMPGLSSYRPSRSVGTLWQDLQIHFVRFCFNMFCANDSVDCRKWHRLHTIWPSVWFAFPFMLIFFTHFSHIQLGILSTTYLLLIGLLFLQSTHGGRRHTGQMYLPSPV